MDAAGETLRMGRVVHDPRLSGRVCHEPHSRRAPEAGSFGV
jgi:hypothetical protein